MPKKILIIDDDADLLEAVSFLLEEAGYTTAIAVDGEIITKLKDINPDLILIDQNLDGEDGVALCKTIKTNSDTNHFPILILSADENISAQILNCKADGFVKKPLVVEELKNKIEHHINLL